MAPSRHRSCRTKSHHFHHSSFFSRLNDSNETPRYIARNTNTKGNTRTNTSMAMPLNTRSLKLNTARAERARVRMLQSRVYACSVLGCACWVTTAPTDLCNPPRQFSVPLSTSPPRSCPRSCRHPPNFDPTTCLVGTDESNVDGRKRCRYSTRRT